ncbi:MAG: hypothetical protein AAGN66_22995 [Acidobacteriota bacterium]
MNDSTRTPSDRAGDSGQDLVRLLHGELGAAEAAALQRRIDQDEELRRRWQHLRTTWGALAPPPPTPTPEDLVHRVLARARREADGGSWRLAPTWAKASAGLAGAFGLTFGILLGGMAPAGPLSVEVSRDQVAALQDPAEEDVGDAFGELGGLPTLAETYLLALEDSGGLLDPADRAADQGVAR